jgi:HD superfamily phosphohydrolase
MIKEFRASEKKIYDPIHGFIRFDEHEKLLIDSFCFQRLHYIHQLGATYLVFPGATHSRFEHSLGVMTLASEIYRRLCKNVRPDLFNFLPRSGSVEYLYWKKVIRLAALCHDLGHLPFSHVAEKDILLSNKGHEMWTLKIIRSESLEKIWRKLQKKALFTRLESKQNLIDDVIKLALGEQVLKKIDPEYDYNFNNWERILSEIIIGDFFGADRIDYLLRDAKFTGIVYGLFDYLQLIESLRILPQGSELKLGIDENGIESCESLLLARHFMHKRVYQYPSVRAYNFHLKRFMRIFYSEKEILKDVSNFLSQNDATVINELNLAAKIKTHKGHEDAKKIIFRKDRFKAIALSDTITKKDLINFKTKNNIEDSQIEWEFMKQKEKLDLTFPVIKHHLAINKAKDASFLLSKIPASMSNWVYVTPEFEIPMLQFLEKK